MLSKCSNPSCSAAFRNLKDGRLFLLEEDPLAGSRKSKREEYFWLCHVCSSTMTLRLGEGGKVIPVLLPAVIQGKPDGVAVHSEDRKSGLFLRSVNSPRQEHGRGHAGVGRRRIGHDAA